MGGRDRGEGGDPVGVRRAELPCDGAAPVVADDVHLLAVHRVDEGHHVAGELPGRVVAVGWWAEHRGSSHAGRGPGREPGLDESVAHRAPAALGLREAVQAHHHLAVDRPAVGHLEREAVIGEGGDPGVVGHGYEDAITLGVGCGCALPNRLRHLVSRDVLLRLAAAQRCGGGGCHIGFGGGCALPNRLRHLGFAGGAAPPGGSAASLLGVGFAIWVSQSCCFAWRLRSVVGCEARAAT